MNPATTARQTLDLLLPEWQALLQGWGSNGQLVAAARDALQLPETPAALNALGEQWAAGFFEALPPMLFPSEEAMSDASGEYAISTGSICPKADWLETAGDEPVFALVTEELGHHVHGLLNAAYSAGDDGELFGALLLEHAGLSSTNQKALRLQNDHGSLLPTVLNPLPLAVELAENTPSYQLRSTPISPASHGRSRRNDEASRRCAAMAPWSTVATPATAARTAESPRFLMEAPTSSPIERSFAAEAPWSPGATFLGKCFKERNPLNYLVGGIGQMSDT